MQPNRLKLFRETYDYTQEKVATHLGIAQNTYSKIELGQIKLSVDHAKKLAILYEVTIGDILSQESNVVNFQTGSTNNGSANGYVQNLHSTEKVVLDQMLALKDQIISSKEQTIGELQNEITFLKKQNEQLLSMVGKTGK
jgi:DNA-binding XRE family transcriptional regulator